MNLQQQLTYEIQGALIEHRVSHIIMNPITFKKLLNEIGMADDLSNYRFMGFKIYRSEDIVINKFIVG
jgi:hypothetical protein